MTDMSNPTNRLQQARHARGLDQRQLAERIGMAPRTLQRYEYGELIPKLDVARDIARVLGTSVDYLWPEREERRNGGGTLHHHC